MTSSLFNKHIVLITGASSGFGAEMARLFAQQGARLILLARREERLKVLQQELYEAYQTESERIVADIRDFSTLKTELERVEASFGMPTILINNAGLVRGRDKLWENTPEQWNEVLDTNVKGILNMIHLIVPKMLQANQGHIINIGSISGHEVYPGGGVYCASKFAVRALNDTLRMELVDTPLRVSLVSPGMAETEFSAVRFYQDTHKAQQVYQGIEALQAQDIAEAVLYLASQPAHVNVGDIIVYPTHQATSQLIYRKT